MLYSTRDGCSLAFDKRNDSEHHFWKIISTDTSRYGGTILLCYSISPFKLMLQRSKGTYILSMSLHLANVAKQKIQNKNLTIFQKSKFFVLKFLL